MNDVELIKIPNPETQLNIIRRYMHVLALLQNKDDEFNWNGTSLADILSMEEDIDGGLSDKIVRDYIKKFLVDELGFDIQTKKGSRRSVLGEPIPPATLEKIAAVYLSFTVTDSSRELVLKRLIEKHPLDCLWMLGRIHFAILMKKIIKFEYVKQLAVQGEPKQYILHPYHIVLRNNNMYLLGKSPRSGKVILFIFNRIASLTVTDEEYPEETVSAAEHFKDALGAFIGKKFSVRLRIDRESFRYVDEIISSLEPIYKETDEGKNVIASFDLSDGSYLCKQMFPFGNAVEILEPAELRQTMVSLLKEGLDMYK